MEENDIVRIVKGKHKNKVGKIETKTANGWYYVKLNHGTERFRLVDIAKGTKKTKGEKEAKRIDKELEKKKKQIKKKFEELNELIKKGKDDKHFRKKMVDVRKLIKVWGLSESDTIFLLNKKTKKRKTKKLSTIKE